MAATAESKAAQQLSRVAAVRSFPPPLPHGMESMRGPGFTNCEWLWGGCRVSRVSCMPRTGVL